MLNLEKAVADAIRAACPTEEQCLKDEAACFEQHPIHMGGSINGVIDMVYADVDGLAKLVASVVLALRHDEAARRA